MKHYYLLGLTMLVVLLSPESFSQTNTFPASGNVGIGTTTPQNLLHIYSNSTSEITQIKLHDIGSWAYGQLHNIEWQDYANAAVGSVGMRYSPTNGTVDFILHSLYNGGYKTSSDISFIVKGNGNVGIGTTTPGIKLTVSKSISDTHWNAMNISYVGSWSTAQNKHANIIFGNSDSEVTGNPIAAIGATYDGYGRIDFHSFYNGGFKTDDDIIMSIRGNGNVGIGTTSPSQKLSVIGNTYTEGNITINNSAGLYQQVGGVYKAYLGYDVTGYLQLYNFTSTNYLRLLDAGGLITDGNVGIGTTNPLSKLEVKSGNLLIRNLDNTDNSSAIMIAHSINESNYTTFGTSIRTITQSQIYNTYGLQFFTQETYATGQTEKMRILGTGNVLIGKTTQTNTAYKLDVEGKIRAHEVVVNTTGADFVFAPGYKLLSLPEVEKFIKENNHLPDLAPATKMKENGMNVSEMQTKLLQKIEELTIYAIEQNKSIELLKQEINELKKK